MTTAATAITNEPDLALLQRYAGTRDEDAFAQIVRRYAGLVFSAAYRVLGDRARAEEVAQETFLRLMRKPQAVTRSLVGWLHNTVTQLAIDEIRSSSARKQRELNYVLEKSVEPTAWKELSPYIDEALAELPDKQRELLVEHFLNARSQQELAAARRTSASTISRRMQDAIIALRQRLRAKGVIVPLALLAVLLGQSVTEAAPAALVAELGKMAMVSGGQAATVKLVISTKTLVLAGLGVLAVLAALILALLALLSGPGGAR
jgi:RNA polymerase sigma factor (sigma-70 family)